MRCSQALGTAKNNWLAELRLRTAVYGDERSTMLAGAKPAHDFKGAVPEILNKILSSLALPPRGFCLSLIDIQCLGQEWLHMPFTSDMTSKHGGG